MEGGTEFDLKSIEVEDETGDKKWLSTSSDKQPSNGWFSHLFKFTIDGLIIDKSVLWICLVWWSVLVLISSGIFSE